MNDIELNPKFIDKINKIKKEKSINVNNFKKRYKYDEDDLELSEKTKRDLKRSREEYKEGKIYTLDEIKKSIRR